MRFKYKGVNLHALSMVKDTMRCPKCDEQVSEDLHTCPKCGTPVSNFIKNPEDYGFLFLIINSTQVPADC